MRSFEIHDCTFRDGLQGGHAEATNVRDVRRAIQAADEIGIRVHELGFAIHRGGTERIQMGLDMDLIGKVAAFGRTHEADIAAIINLATPIGVLVGKSRVRDARNALRITPEANLHLVENSVQNLVSAGIQVIYDAEHAFEGLETDTTYTLETLEAARRGGASCLALCDTTGGMMSDKVSMWTRKVVATFPNVEIGFHGHNDCGMGVANAQAAWQAGATHLQGTFLGTGERCSNTDLSILIPNLVLKFGADGIPKEKLRNLTSAMQIMASALNLEVPDNHPWIGRNAFFTSAGMHESGDQRDPGSYWHAEPAAVGNEARTGVNDQSGKANVLKKAAELGIEIPEDRLPSIMREFNERASRGENFNLAEASFEMFLRRKLEDSTGDVQFRRWWLLIEHAESAQVETEASLRIVSKGEENPQKLHNADGDGPVNALEKALQRTLKRRYPFVETIRISDFRMQMLEIQRGSASTVRVICEFSDGENRWKTLGVHENMVEAAWLALWDGYLWKILKSK